MSGSNPTLAPGSVLGTRPALRKDVRDSVPFGGSTDSGDARPSCGPGPGSMRRRVGTAPARWAARGRWGRAAPWCAPPGSAATGRERKGGEEHLCEVSSPELLESRNGAWLRGMQVATEASHS